MANPLASALIERMRQQPTTLTDVELGQLRNEAFFADVAQRIDRANDPADRALLRAMITHEMAIRPTRNEHDGDRLVLLCLLLAHPPQCTDLELLWQVKQLDFDMGCLLDAELFVFAGVAETFAYLQSEPASWAKACLSYLQECREAGSFDDLADYLAGRRAYFGLG